VAGHNLDAAYISAYFHGVVHAWCGATSPSRHHADLNQFLLEKWNDRDLGEALEQRPRPPVRPFLEVPASGGG
jgi:hypothetical protein